MPRYQCCSPTSAFGDVLLLQSQGKSILALLAPASSETARAPAVEGSSGTALLCCDGGRSWEEARIAEKAVRLIQPAVALR